MQIGNSQIESGACPSNVRLNASFRPRCPVTRGMHDQQTPLPRPLRGFSFGRHSFLRSAVRSHGAVEFRVLADACTHGSTQVVFLRATDPSTGRQERASVIADILTQARLLGKLIRRHYLAEGALGRSRELSSGGHTHLL